ncbi:guanylate kinase [Gloeobacter violaceus]|uniref:Guanylate kinase n=1 Tax=Gloeobacter violaceus (strain ATCC 29082 / PCC 7421) TaxID=251221 RepID=KGUA_GLOVI|nr:RecName: Full=Guanylate kinase; AltName: Full=GMP kinase [Gloeobacter violaceus PCC 7421]BAC89562.1 guanylate kinase [Gloeobacter violaceus PCC 7421]
MPFYRRSAGSPAGHPLSRLLVLSGPSGVGKDTILREVRERHPGLYVSVSATTRPPRPGEVDGRDYRFLSAAEFEEWIATDDLLEWACYVGNYYGTPKTPVLERLAVGEPVVLEIDVQGALQVKNNFPAAMLVFIRPPSLEVLAERLRSRGTDAPEAIERRLARAREELALADRFDHQVVNDKLAAAVEAVERLLFEEIPDEPAGG